MFHIGKANEISRRAFMRRSSQLAVMGAASGYAMGLAGLSDAAAFDNTGGYKALVCVFLLGGNDHANTIIPFDATNYARYSSIRGGLPDDGGIAIAREPLASQVLNPIEAQTLTDDMQLALAPTMPRLKARFDQGVMAPLLNVGPLIVPLTRQQYDSNSSSFPRPAKLFSHNDQQSTWQSGSPEGSVSGWGGRIGDLAASSNTNSMFTAINATGNAVFLSGDQTQPYGISSSGAIEIAALGRNLYGSSAASQALRELLTNGTGHVFENDYAMANARSIQFSGFVNDALQNANLATDFGTGNSLAQQLEIVARLIASRNQLGVQRQVFLVATGGFDNHDGLIGTHEGLLSGLDFALDAFYRAMSEVGVADRVTAFTASDFGRTLASNGDGSDHGWGSHHFVARRCGEGGTVLWQGPEDFRR